MSPLVSILIPCHNAAPWLPATLESALGQTHPRCEIIVVDDGSTDDSATIAHTFAARGVTVLTQPNRGAAAARNRALQAATGEFFQYLDADDLLSSGKIAAQLARLADRPAGCVASCAWGRFSEDPATAVFADGAVGRDFTAVEFLTLAGDTGAMMHPSAWLVPRRTARQTGPWNEQLSLNDDGEYFARIVLASPGIVYCDDRTAKSYYRSRLTGSLSQRRDERARRSAFRSLELLTGALTAAESSFRTRRACAGYWRRFIHDFYPFPPDLIHRAEAEVSRLGETVGEPVMGPRTALLARCVGWRRVWRLKHYLSR